MGNRQLPITNHQLPITNYQSPITNYQLPITNYQLLQLILFIKNFTGHRLFQL
ncbi:MAG: alpha/beta hydrolase [Scytonematopsis contorta HA4267-MV1]|nr:alpha/beta hydrolase [Scytonematopsis contorta HA4267-MV1]